MVEAHLCERHRPALRRRDKAPRGTSMCRAGLLPTDCLPRVLAQVALKAANLKAEEPSLPALAGPRSQLALSPRSLGGLISLLLWLEVGSSSSSSQTFGTY